MKEVDEDDYIPPLCRANRNIVAVEGTMRLFLYLSDLHRRACFGVFENLAVVVLP